MVNEGQYNQREVKVTIGNTEVQLEACKRAEEADFTLSLDDPSDDHAVAVEAEKYLKGEYWFLAEKWQGEVLHERFSIQLDEKTVDIFNFANPLTEVEKISILATLKKLYGSLKNKDLWSLKSIQISSSTPHNKSNDEAMRGEFSGSQGRFELYPEAFTERLYRKGELDCTELEGTILHEGAHVVLEDVLREEWEKSDLGWERCDNFLVQLPGGWIKNTYNTKPTDCPTTYAAHEENDDRADSVVAFLVEPDKLSEKRTEIVAKYISNNDSAVVKISSVEAQLPVTPQQLKYFPKLRGSIHWQDVDSGESPQIIQLDELRKKLGIVFQQ